MSWESRIRTCEDLQEVRFVYDNPRLSKLALFSSVSPKCTVGGWDTPTHAHKRKGALSITFSMPKPNLSWEGTNTLPDKVLPPHNWTLSPPLLSRQDSNLRRLTRSQNCLPHSPFVLSLRLVLRYYSNELSEQDSNLRRLRRSQTCSPHSPFVLSLRLFLRYRSNELSGQDSNLRRPLRGRNCSPHSPFVLQSSMTLARTLSASRKTLACAFLRHHSNVFFIFKPAL